ncbi:uncharacterized protein C2orf81 homolog [Clavelina lepadiformis]|uniref:uncharacterized protein C2orf81 homolog n=1 Tax=Clavelina lepadiformis TaxID=159417 RepID=UPI0040413439
MSRQTASRSRTEKGASRGGAGSQSVTAPAVTNDVVPGRLSYEDWTQLMQDEEDTGFVCSLVEEIVDQALEGCYQKYIWEQMLPFTVHQAKDALLQIVQWHFLSRDSGEVNIVNDPGWKEDSEPEAGVIDSWAQGSVPVVVRRQSSSVPSVSMISEEQTYLQGQGDDPNFIADSLVSGTEPTATTISDEHTDSTEKTVEKEPTVAYVSPQPQNDEKNTVEPDLDSVKVIKKKRPSYKKHTGRLPPPQVTDFETVPKPRPTSDKSESRNKSDAHLSPSQKTLLKVQAGRPPGNREVTFDERGNVVGVMKLNAHTLPMHRVRVQYSIIDPEAEANAQRLAAMRTGRIRRVTKSKWKSDDSSIITRSSEVDSHKPMPPGVSATTTSYFAKNTVIHQQTSGPESSPRNIPSASQIKKSREARIDPLPPSLIDTIDASPGVIIREGDHVKEGPDEKTAMRIGPADYHLKECKQPVLRLLGRKSAALRPTIDPQDVVQNVTTSNTVSTLAIKHPLPPIGTSQTAGN